jgi:hypothetical protein
MVIAEVGERKIAHTGFIPGKTYPVREVAPGTGTLQPRQQFTNVRQVRNDDGVIPDPIPAGAHHIVLLVLLPAFVIVLAVAVQMQSEITELVSHWITLLHDAITQIETSIRGFWLKA